MKTLFKNDIVLKDYFKNPRYFADFINGILFDGNQIIDYHCLSLYDSEISTVIKSNSFIKDIELRRDIIFKYDDGHRSMLIGIENQKYQDRLMLFRCLSYDSMLYQRQINNLTDKKAEQLSKVMSVVINWSEYRWNTKSDLYSYFDVLDDEKKAISNYKVFTLNILDIDYHVFKEKSNYDLIKIIQLIYKFKKDPEKLKGIIIDQDIAIIVASIVDEEDDVLKKIVLKQGGKIDMCESLREFYADGIREGYDNGIKEGYDNGIKEERIKNTKQLFKHFYPNEDSSIIDNLTTEQCDQIFSMILDNRSLEDITELAYNKA